MPRHTASAALEEVDRHMDNCVRYVREHGMHPCFLINVLVVDEYHTTAAADAAKAKKAADEALEAAEIEAACAREFDDDDAAAEADAKANSMRLAAQRAAAKATSAADAAKAMADAQVRWSQSWPAHKWGSVIHRMPPCISMQQLVVHALLLAMAGDVCSSASYWHCQGCMYVCTLAASTRHMGQCGHRERTSSHTVCRFHQAPACAAVLAAEAWSDHIPASRGQA